MSVRTRPRLLCYLQLVVLLAVVSVHRGVVASEATTGGEEPRVDFTKDVQPILAKRCFACHGPDEAEGGLRFTDQKAALAETDSGEFAIVPGDVDASVLIARISSDDESERMPPEGDPVAPEEIETLRRWIEQGAVWEKHWAFNPMKRYDPPRVDDPLWRQHPIDAFIFDSLQVAGLNPSPPADRPALIRRAYYDLTGLPPTADQVQQFVDDSDPLAFQRLIDELLDSHHYGERWGRHWLDLVRYAETNSYERDGPKPNAWKYRDYVIGSFNDDKPYDQFIQEQLAGDELDVVTTETLTATGYYRLGIWDDEPADPLQARFDELDDIIMTTSQAMLGLTVNCARCHDHKIDPIPQKDYYSMLALLADVTSWGHRGDQVSNNQIDVSSPDLTATYLANDEARKRIEGEIHEIEQAGIAKMSAPDQRATEGPKKDRNRVLNQKLKDHLGDDQWETYRSLKKELAEVIRQRKVLPPRVTVMGLARCNADPKQTFVFYRGNPHSPSDAVEPSFPAIFETPSPTPSDFKATDRSAGRRRVLAEWITSPDNRLAARVIANRLWQFHFGRGIVRSSNNFGRLGTPPTHPELLDWLAHRLIDGGWKLKPMHRLIMTSRAYQMSSRARPEPMAIDPNNDFLWRFDPRRLSAEEVRDSILAANGSLNRTPYGPSFYPTLSQEVLAGQSRPGSGWGKSAVDQQNRRSVYIHVKRSLLTPLLTAFDFPDPDLTCEERFHTLQPGQALSLLNSDFIHEQAGRLAASLDADEIDDQELVRRTVPAVLARNATSGEIDDGSALIKSLQSEYGVTRQARGATLLFDRNELERVSFPRLTSQELSAPSATPLRPVTPHSTTMTKNKKRIGFCGRTRREFIWQAGGGFGAAALASMLSKDGFFDSAAATDTHYKNPLTAKPPHFAPKAKSVIFLFMYGGPSHIDTFDRKPKMKGMDGKTVEVKTFGRGGHKTGGRIVEPRWEFQQYGQCGKWVSTLFPNVARHVDDIAFLHSMTADSPIHGSAMLMMNSGKILSGSPALGSWVNYGLGSVNENLPGFVVMLDPTGGPISGAKNWSSGYMPATYQGNVFRTEGAPILDLAPPSDLPDGVQRRLIDSIQSANSRHLSTRAGNDDLASRIASYELAYKMQTTAPEAVDLSTEDAPTLELYGINEKRTRDFGTRCLLARRLVQRGVRFIQLYSGGAHNDDNWDAHGDLEMNHNKHAGNTDLPIAALLTDLKQRGLLDETLVVWGGEFGRQPTAEYAEGSGRDHNSYGFTMWMAGGGIKGGVSYGTTDELGSRAVGNPLHVKNLHATILHQLGLDPNRLAYFYSGLDQKLVGVEEVEPIHEIIA